MAEPVRRDRSDITVRKLAEKHGIPEESIRNENGRKTRKDKQLGTIRKDKKK